MENKMENHTTEQSADTRFGYVYSAKDQDEIRRIRQKYQPSEEDGIVKLRKLDESVTQKATMTSLILGVLGALVMGTGMSLILTEFGALFGLTGLTAMLTGALIGAFGIVLVAAAYPVYTYVLKKEREKIAPEIIRLTEELLK